MRSSGSSQKEHLDEKLSDLPRGRSQLRRLALAAVASAALPVKSVPFTAKYAGQASTKVDGNTATIAAKAPASPR